MHISCNLKSLVFTPSSWSFDFRLELHKHVHKCLFNTDLAFDVPCRPPSLTSPTIFLYFPPSTNVYWFFFFYPNPSIVASMIWKTAPNKLKNKLENKYNPINQSIICIQNIHKVLLIYLHLFTHNMYFIVYFWVNCFAPCQSKFLSPAFFSYCSGILQWLLCLFQCEHTKTIILAEVMPSFWVKNHGKCEY